MRPNVEHLFKVIATVCLRHQNTLVPQTHPSLIHFKRELEQGKRVRKER